MKSLLNLILIICALPFVVSCTEKESLQDVKTKVSAYITKDLIKHKTDSIIYQVFDKVDSVKYDTIEIHIFNYNDSICVTLGTECTVFGMYNGKIGALKFSYGIDRHLRNSSRINAIFKPESWDIKDKDGYWIAKCYKGNLTSQSKIKEWNKEQKEYLEMKDFCVGSIRLILKDVGVGTLTYECESKHKPSINDLAKIVQSRIIKKQENIYKYVFFKYEDNDFADFVFETDCIILKENDEIYKIAGGNPSRVSF